MPALFPQTFKGNPVALLDNANGTTPVTLVTGATNGTKVKMLTAYNTDSTNPVNIKVTITNGGTTAVLNIAEVAAASNKDLLDPNDLPAVDDDGSIVIGPSSTLEVVATAAPASGESVSVIATIVEY